MRANLIQSSGSLHSMLGIKIRERRLKAFLLIFIASTALAETNILFHPYWEVHRYDHHDIELIDRVNGGNHSNLLGMVWWMKAHTTTNAPSFHIEAGSQYGWFDLEWAENLSGPWHQINFNHHQYPYTSELYKTETNETGVVIAQHYRRKAPVFKVYMHPESDVTKRMMKSKSGFFKQRTHWDNKIYRADMSGFWPLATNKNQKVTIGTLTPPPIPK